MNRITAAVIAGSLAAVAAAVFAHDGESHGSERPVLPEFPALHPQMQPDGRLFVPKPVQRLLGMRTSVAPATPPLRQIELVAEVVADRRSLGSIKAPQAGTLEAAEHWSLPGQTVAAGDVLAWLRPLMAQRETARRRAELAKIEQKLLIARMNYERLRMQSDGLAEPAPNNLYFEQADLERQALQQQRELAIQGIAERVAIRAPTAGVLAATPVREGEVVAAGQSLFEIADPMRLQLSAITHDPALVSQLRGARLRLDGISAPLPLVLRGSEPLAGPPGWRLLFDAIDAPARPLLPGAVLRIEADVVGDGAVLAQQACVVTASGEGVLWVHVAPEIFAPRQLSSCATAWPPEVAGERWVTVGAALLQQYR